MSALPSPKLPRRLTVPGYRFRHEPAIWHVIGMTLWGTGLLPRPVRQWWSTRYLAAVNRDINESREREYPQGV